MSLDWLAQDNETPAGGQHESAAPPWKVLIVDDEPEVHRVTRLALRRFRYEGRPVELLSAENGQQACDIARQHPDLAVIFLDVVMEADDAGLKVIGYIRNTLDNHMVRIIVRTGQAGRAPEIDVVARYDINGYREKTELTSDKLMSQLYTCLSSYRDLLALKNEMRRREEADNKLVQQYAKLQEAYRRLEHFAKAASHDLQEPLRKIQLWTDRLIESTGAHPGDPAHEAAMRLVDSAGKVSGMIEALKNSSLLESGQQSMISVDLNRLLAEISEEAGQGAEGDRLTLEYSALPVIQGDSASLRLLFHTLISDVALIDPGRNNIVVRIWQSEAPAGRVRLHVQDNGSGIAAGELPKLFEPYSRVVINGRASSGMGLYLCKRIAETHSGSIEGRSQPGSGCEIIIELPA